MQKMNNRKQGLGKHDSDLELPMNPIKKQSRVNKDDSEEEFPINKANQNLTKGRILKGDMEIELPLNKYNGYKSISKTNRELSKLEQEANLLVQKENKKNGINILEIINLNRIIEIYIYM